MSVRNVAVIGAGGKTGRAVSRALADAGTPVRGIGRRDWPRLGDALRGCAAVYVIAPNLHPDEPAFVSQVVAAAQVAGVQRIGYHSVASPYVPSMPHHLGKARAEDVVRRSGLAWTVLQPCAYVQNLVPGLRTAVPAVRAPYDVDRPHGLVDLDEVAVCAAVVMDDESHHGATYELGGPLVTLREVAAVASSVLGAPVGVERLDPGAWATGEGAGLEVRERDWLLAMFDYYDRHGFPAGSLTLEALLGRPGRSLAETLRRELAPGAG